MPIKFKDDVAKSVEASRREYLEAVRNGEDNEVIEAKQGEYMNAFATNLKDELLTQARQEALDSTNDSAVKLNRGQNVLTSEETKFFSNLVEDDANYDYFKEEKLLPETTVLRIFEDIKAERPLLSKINFQLAGLRARFIVGDPEGAAVYGEIFGKIQGQIGTNFKEVSFTQNKLTAFAIVPKDLKEFGPEWIERYVRALLAEAIAVKTEEKIVLGQGAASNEPYGIMKDLTLDAEGNITGATDKTSSGTLTFADAEATASELAGALAQLSVKENGKTVNVSNGVLLLVNPADQFAVKASNTMQTANGMWVTSLPFNVELTPSEFIPQGKAVFLVAKRYYAVQTGSLGIKAYDQTLALEDADTYIAKTFNTGMPEDNKAALVYDLAVGGTTTSTTTTTTTAGA